MTFTQKQNELKMVQFDDTLVPLVDLCDQQDLEILFVTDCGSHAWGFAQETSDWDVKFVYMHKDKDKYLSLFEPMQHTSFQGDNVSYDGYDIKKFLNLTLKGNANAYEMVASQYLNAFTGDTARSLADFTTDVLSENLDKVLAHYSGLAHNTYKDRIKNVGEVTLKKWFYVVRPLLCCQHIFDEQKLPPLDFEQLLDYAEWRMNTGTLSNDGRIPADAIKEMRMLLRMKRDGDLTKVGDMPMENVDRFAQGALLYWRDYLNDLKEFGMLQEKVLTTPDNFDTIYRELLNGTFEYPK